MSSRLVIIERFSETPEMLGYLDLTYFDVLDLESESLLLLSGVNLLF